MRAVTSGNRTQERYGRRDGIEPGLPAPSAAVHGVRPDLRSGERFDVAAQLIRPPILHLTEPPTALIMTLHPELARAPHAVPQDLDVRTFVGSVDDGFGHGR